MHRLAGSNARCDLSGSAWSYGIRFDSSICETEWIGRFNKIKIKKDSFTSAKNISAPVLGSIMKSFDIWTHLLTLQPCKTGGAIATARLNTSVAAHHVEVVDNASIAALQIAGFATIASPPRVALALTAIGRHYPRVSTVTVDLDVVRTPSHEGLDSCVLHRSRNIQIRKCESVPARAKIPISMRCGTKTPPPRHKY